MTTLPPPPTPDRYDTSIHGPRANLWWGIMGIIVIEIMVFGSLLVSYYYLKVHNPQWPPGDTEDLLLPTINTVVLLMSSYAIYYADKEIVKDNERGLKIGMVSSVVLALMFLVFKYFEFAGKEYSHDTHAYGSVVYTVLGLHTIHVVGVLLKSIVVTILAFRGYWKPNHHAGVQVNGLYWHFVVAIWFPIYFTIYLTPLFT